MTVLELVLDNRTGRAAVKRDLICVVESAKNGNKIRILA